MEYSIRSAGKSLLTSSHNLCSECGKEPNKKVHCEQFGEIRRSTTSTINGYEITICDNKDIEAKRLYREKIIILATLAAEIEKNLKDKHAELADNMDIVFHNLTSYNAQCIQKGESLIG